MMIHEFKKATITFRNGSTMEVRNGKMIFHDGILNVKGDTYDGTVTSPIDRIFKREEYEQVEVE